MNIQYFRTMCTPICVHRCAIYSILLRSPNVQLFRIPAHWHPLSHRARSLRSLSSRSLLLLLGSLRWSVHLRLCVCVCFFSPTCWPSLSARVLCKTHCGRRIVVATPHQPNKNHPPSTATTSSDTHTHTATDHGQRTGHLQTAAAASRPRAGQPRTDGAGAVGVGDANVGRRPVRQQCERRLRHRRTRESGQHGGPAQAVQG